MVWRPSQFYNMNPYTNKMGVFLVNRGSGIRIFITQKKISYLRRTILPYQFLVIAFIFQMIAFSMLASVETLAILDVMALIMMSL